MVAAKSLRMGLVVAALALGAGSSTGRAGGIIAAGSSGTLYYGGNANNAGYGAGLTVMTAAPVAAVVPAARMAAPVAAPVTAPAPPPVVAAAPAVAATSTYSSPTFGAMTYSAPAAAQVATAGSFATLPTVGLPATAVPTPPTTYDAFINFGTGPYLDQGLLTTGTAQSWTTSPALVQAFGHTPSASELNDFTQAVLQRVESTFAQSGLNITATTDPNAHANHTLSVVSGLSAATNPDAIGITNVGHNGFDFIDKLAYANSPDQLEWAVAHNVSHELMHAFGGEHHLTPEGNNLDAPVSDWSVLIDPNTKFSAASVAEMTTNLRAGGLALKYGTGAEGLNVDGQEITVQPVPEPATFALWGGLVGVAVVARRRSRKTA